MKKALILLIMLIVIITNMLSTDLYKRVKVFMPDEATYRKFLSTGIDMEGAVGKIGGWVEVTLSNEELKNVNLLGFQTQVLVEDLTKYFSGRLTKIPYNALGFGDGSMGGNYTFDEVVQQLDSMRNLYPTLISEKFSIGNTLQGRNIWAVRLTKYPDIVSSKPEVLYTALTHAREPQGMMNLIYFMWHLLQNYGSDSGATYLVDNRQLYFVPVINADGYEANRRISPSGGGMRRKNMRNVVTDNDSYGVDLNRNYGYKWGLDDAGSSPYTTSATYRGAGPFSEPEILSVALFCVSQNIKVAFNYHSYGNLLLYPWDHTSLNESPDSVLFAEYGQDMTKYNHYFTGPSGKSLYLVNGGATDWMYGEQDSKNKIFSFLPEVGSSGDGFWPSSSRILPIAQENLYPNLYLANVAGSYPRIQSSLIVDQSGDGFLEKGEPFTCYLTVRNKGLDTTSNLTLELSTSSSAIQTTSIPYSPGTIAPVTNFEISVPCTVSAAAPSNFYSLYLKIKEEPNRYIYDTVKIFVGKFNLAFSDSGENGFGNWVTNVGWGLSAISHSPVNSFTDSPGRNYTDITDNSMTLSTPFDMHNTEKIFLRFWCRWDIESEWDFATVEASSDGGASWSTVPGRYTRPASGIGVQVAGTFGYDGVKSEWVEDEMDVSQYASSNFKIRFRLKSDDYVTRDGFYVDDIRFLVNYKDTTQRTLSITLNDQWNLVSIPIDTESVVKDSIFPTSISSAYAYSGSSYIPLDTLRRLVGYWLKFNSPTEVQWKGTPNLSGIIGVAEGWNLIGSISEPIPVTNITSNPPDIITSAFFKYSSSYGIADSIHPGLGYWVKVSQSGSLIFSLNSARSASSPVKIKSTSEFPPPPPFMNTDAKEIPAKYSLDDAFPNPFNPSTVINYQLPIDSRVSLKVYNVLGQVANILAEEVQEVGFKSITWNASGSTSGIYFIKLEAIDIADPSKVFTQVKKVLLLK